MLSNSVPLHRDMDTLLVRFHHRESSCSSKDAINLLPFLQYLHFRVHYSSKPECSQRTHYRSDLQERPLKQGDTRTEQLLNGWQEAIAYLAQHTKAGYLHLSVICDVGDFDTALDFVEPLHQFPRSKGFGLRLAYHRHERIVELVMDVSCDLLHLQRVQPFRYFDLPEEIRLIMLEYTDLVSPLRDVS